MCGVAASGPHQRAASGPHVWLCARAVVSSARAVPGHLLTFCAFFRALPPALLPAAIDMLQAAMMSGAVKDEAEIASLIAELKA